MLLKLIIIHNCKNINGESCNTPTHSYPAKGCGLTTRTGFTGLAYSSEYFNTEPKPDIIIDAFINFEVNVKTKAGVDVMNVPCTSYFKTFTEKNKKPFKFRVNYTHPHGILYKPKIKTCSGFELVEDISQHKLEAIYEAFKLIYKDIPKEIEGVNKFYANKQITKRKNNLHCCGVQRDFFTQTLTNTYQKQ